MIWNWGEFHGLSEECQVALACRFLAGAARCAATGKAFYTLAQIQDCLEDAFGTALEDTRQALSHIRQDLDEPVTAYAARVRNVALRCYDALPPDLLLDAFVVGRHRDRRRHDPRRGTGWQAFQDPVELLLSAALRTSPDAPY